MSKGRVIAIVVSLLLFLTVAVFFFNSRSKDDIVWYENYRMENKEPYGTYALSVLLDEYFPKQSYKVIQKPVHKVLDAAQLKVPSNYVCVSDYLFWSDRDEDSLLSFIKNGNNAFISVKEFPVSFINKLSDRDYQELNALSYFSSRSSIQLDVEDGSDSTYKYFFYNGKGMDTTYEWNSISVNLDSMVLSEIFGTYKAIESDTSYVNFVKIKYGKGALYLHTMPLVFTNYHLITRPGREYAEKVLSFLPEGEVYWDNVSQSYSFQQEGRQEKSPLSFILSKKSLRWAWYFCLGSILLYIIFRAKRKQRVISVIEPNINTSIMFIETIGKLYYMQNNHHKVAILKMKHFINFIRMRYKVNLIRDNMYQKAEQLSVISGVDPDIISSIFDKYERLSLLGTTSAQELLEFNSIIQKFYKNCK